jgi:hypothetical protein
VGSVGTVFRKVEFRDRANLLSKSQGTGHKSQKSEILVLCPL